MVAIGRVRRAVGLDGRVEVELYSRVADQESDQAAEGGVTRLTTGAEFTVGGRIITVDRVGNGRKGLVAVYFKGMHDRDSAESLRGAELEVPESELPVLPEGAYYHYQLIGCIVAELSGRQVGTLTGIMETGANDVYVVTAEDGRDLLVPATKETIVKIDIVERLVTVDLAEAVAGSVTPE